MYLYQDTAVPMAVYLLYCYHHYENGLYCPLPIHYRHHKCCTHTVYREFIMPQICMWNTVECHGIHLCTMFSKILWSSHTFNHHTRLPFLRCNLDSERIREGVSRTSGKWPSPSKFTQFCSCIYWYVLACWYMPIHAQWYNVYTNGLVLWKIQYYVCIQPLQPSSWWLNHKEIPCHM